MLRKKGLYNSKGKLSFTEKVKEQVQAQAQAQAIQDTKMSLDPG